MSKLPDGLWARMLLKRRITPTGCWIWTGSKMTAKNPKFRYGEVRVNYKLRRVHRVSAALHLKFDLESPVCVLHRCDRPLCFNPDHLFFGTHADNNADKVAKGRGAKGEASNRGGFTEVQVREVFRLRTIEKKGVREIGRIFKKSHATISNILNGKRWRHIWIEFHTEVIR